MPTLTDTQAILLGHAAARANGSLLPLPATITAPAGAVAKSLASLIKRGLAEERETSEQASIHRSDGDVHLGLFVTTAGQTALGLEEAPDSAPAITPVADDTLPVPKRPTKASLVLELLGRADGATLAELVEATGWLPHTTRAALTGLRKRGHAVERSRRGEASCYRILGAR